MARELHDQVLDIEKKLMLPDLKPGWPDYLNHGMQLAGKLAALTPVVASGDYRPTDQAHEVFAMYVGQIRTVLAAFLELDGEALAAFNRQLLQAQVPPVGA